MDIQIAGKVVVVTGAARGIGHTLALGLAAEGARVAVLARDRKRAQLVVDEIGELPGAPAALALEADVSDEAAVAAVAAAAAEIDAAWGRVDALINNAGWMPGSQPILELEVSVLERVLRSSLIGSFLTTKHFAPLMIRGGGGRIIYLSSAAAVQSNAGGAPYGGSKAAVNILAHVAHLELADDGIRTVALAPGLTDTPGMRQRHPAFHPPHRHTDPAQPLPSDNEPRAAQKRRARGTPPAHACYSFTKKQNGWPAGSTYTRTSSWGWY